MPDVKTVDCLVESTDPLIQKQKEDVAKMRASLLACSDDPTNVASALRNVTILRIYHHLSRIIRYTEMMDKLEQKIYESIDYTVENMRSSDTFSLMALLQIQEKLQKNLMDSQKLIQPYIEMSDKLAELERQASVVAQVDSQNVIPIEDRDRLRSVAQAVLSELDKGA